MGLPLPQLRLLPTGVDEPSAPPLTLDSAFRAYAPFVANLALRILGRRDEVEDVLHDVFLAGHKGLPGLQHPSQARAWLTAVTVRIARRRLRLRRVRSWIGLDEVPEGAEAVDAGANPHDHAVLSATFRALDQLGSEERLAWSLRYLQGERLEAVAAACGCSLATAKRRIASAQKRLQEVLGDG